MAQRELPDLILLDLIMPDMNGFDVVEALNENPATAAIPVVVVTASEITEADRARLNGYVSSIMGKAGFDGKRFMCEVRRAMVRRAAVA
jgi:CheY-like chemotaxis protein